MLRRALLIPVLACLPVALAPVVAASAAAAPTPAGAVGAARQDMFFHRIAVSGWAYDPARSSASVDVRVYVDGRYAGHVRADRPSPGIDRARHITGRHGFRFVKAWARRAGSVTIRSTGAVRTHAAVALGGARVAHVMPAPGTRIVAVAKRYVGRARYVDGGASPRGFDCSGYTQYVYAKAKVRRLPHNAEAQRRMRGMHLISKRHARPGDLVFYLSGGSAFHVAIYAGHGMQYAAATPRDGIRYQRVWSPNVQYRTIWH